MTVTVKTVSGSSVVVVVSTSHTVWDLKALVHEELGCEAALQRLVYAGRELQDDLSIAQVGLSAGSAREVHLVIRRRLPPADPAAQEVAMSVETSAGNGTQLVGPGSKTATVRHRASVRLPL